MSVVLINCKESKTELLTPLLVSAGQLPGDPQPGVPDQKLICSIDFPKLGQDKMLRFLLDSHIESEP